MNPDSSTSPPPAMGRLHASPAHHPHNQPSHLPSDSDTPAPRQSNIPTFTSPPPTTRTNKTLNLSVLQRHLPTTTAIELIVPYAVVYIFSPPREGWEKCGIEGTLFVARTQTPQSEEGYTILVLNRRGLENFVLDLRTSEEVDITDEYVIVRDTSARSDSGEETTEPKIYGLWIFEEERGSTKGTRRTCGEVIVERARRVERMQSMREHQLLRRQDGDNDGPANGPDLMALLNGSRGQRGSDAAPAVLQRGLDAGQVDLLDLFKKAGGG